MKKTAVETTKVVSSEELKSKLIPASVSETSVFAGNNKPAESLGAGRWKFQGKTYKEQSI
jgi:hypothetical protein